MKEASSSKNAAEPNTCCRFFQLPYPLILDILSRLSINDLFHCRCVCKRFLCFVSDSEFARLHLSRSPLCILLKIRDLTAASERLHLVHVDADGANFQVSKLNSIVPKSNLPAFDIISDMSACNGLICLVGAKTDDESFYLCNPILGELITIQSPYSRKDRLRGNFWGLGYSSLTNQYKVLQSYNGNVDWSVERPEIYDCLELAELAASDVRAEIYTIGTGTWRSIGHAPPGLVSLPFNAYLNGAVHWFKFNPRGGEFINSFDFDAEQFGTVPPPDHFQELDEKCAGDTVIGVLGGCLFIVHFVDSMQFDIWVMKKYGVKESWTKQFVIENLSPKGNNWDFYQPMLVLNNGEILMLLEEKAIVCYNQKRKQLQISLRARPVFSTIHAIAYTPCFVSLYNVAKGEQISRIQSSKVQDKICKEGLLGCTGCGDRLV